MEIVDKYLTLTALSEGLYKEKGSKFIAYAAPCYSTDEAKELLTDWKKLHPTARHLCYAYRFGIKKDIYRANDDGEPSNSAGAPIFGQIQSADLTNVLVGVIRYFGGTKLGVGGLITAYKTAAKEAINEGIIVEKQVLSHLQVKFEYDCIPPVMSAVKALDATIEQQDFALSCELTLALEVDKVAAFEQKLALLSIEIIELGIY